MKHLDASWNRPLIQEFVENIAALVISRLPATQENPVGGHFAGQYVGVAGEGLDFFFHHLVNGERLARNRSEACFRRVNEKLERLKASPELLASWQSRNTDEEMYGGAIRAGEYIFSFSGLSEHADEMICLLVAIELEALSCDEAYRIAKETGNQLYLDFLTDPIHELNEFRIQKYLPNPWYEPRIVTDGKGGIEMHFVLIDGEDVIDSRVITTLEDGVTFAMACTQLIGLDTQGIDNGAIVCELLKACRLRHAAELEAMQTKAHKAFLEKSRQTQESRLLT